MKLSVIIVNYNVEHFLEQCLLSVRQASQGLAVETYVVDNASVDGSCAMVEERFPEVHLIRNRDNVGFSKANNQAVRISKGEYVLLLNPDTVVEEDTFSKIIDFMDAHPKAGGLGVRMVDGKGNFLPESKRGLPTPWVAFCKISGVYRLFKRSKRFNHYYMGYLDEHATNEVEILSGAFMMMRRKALDEVGLLDESFFMYGEDIDLSWRIVKGGWENWYLPETSIIHYKGESTKKGSLNYVFVFYKAMVIFAEKHFSERNARAFSTVINLAIWARAGLAVLSRFVRKVWLPVTDAALLFGGLWLMQGYYAEIQQKIFDATLVRNAFGIYTLTWMLSVFFSGGYDRPMSMLRILRGVLAGSILILIGYSLLPEDLRFSRALVLLGGVWSALYFGLSRVLFHIASPEAHPWEGSGNKRFAVIGTPEEAERIEALLGQTYPGQSLVVSVANEGTPEKGQVGTVNQMDEIIRVHRIDEVIFSSRDVAAGAIIDFMGRFSATGVDFKIAPPDSLYMIGSNSIDTSGDLFMLETNGIHKPANRRKKRVFDLLTALGLLVTLPFNLWFVKHKGSYIGNIFRVFFGQRTWVGYALSDRKGELPDVSRGVISPASGLPVNQRSDELLQRLNVIYARNYRVINDFGMLFRHFRYLGGD
jgi:GT2 family glycosyltransferase